MSEFNFDSDFFRRVISKCGKTQNIPYLSQLVKRAVEVFYEEFDYYPDIAAYAPGSFNLMGDHLEYVKGNLIQGALPMLTVVVGKSLCSLKCRIVTTSKDVDGLRKSVFPIYHYKKNLKVFPAWVNFIKGVINTFPYKDLKGFDAVINSSIPVCQGYGSSAALQVGFYTFLEAVVGNTTCQKIEEKGSLCQLAERPSEMTEYKMGQWNNFTSALAVENNCVTINCRTREVSLFETKDTDILFLLTYPNFEIERKDRDFVPRRQMELKLIAKLLGLEDIIDATGHHLKVLENMEDPSRETVEEILRGLGIDEDIIQEYVDELFTFPPPDFHDFDQLYTEGEFQGEDIYCLSSADGESPGEIEEEKKPRKPCIPGQRQGDSKGPSSQAPTKALPVSYIHQRIAEICAGTVGSNPSLPKRVCEEINCLGGIENLSVASDMTVIGRLLRRLRHIISENQRSLEFPDIVRRGDYVELGEKLIQSHLSLKLDYEVSCQTLDSLVQVAIDSDRVYGAKMTSGGGTLTLLHRSVVEEFVEKITEKFGESGTFQFYLVFPSSGAKITSVGIKRNPKSVLSHSFDTLDDLLKRAVENFQALYKHPPTHGGFSPANVNLIGDHADYNHGYCISLGLNMLTVVVGAFNGTSKVRACTTANIGEEQNKVIFSLPEFDDLKAGNVKWAKLIRGTIVHFKGDLKGFDCIIESSVPCDSGLGSRSALVVAFYTFLEELTGQKTSKPAEKAYQCMMAIHEFSSVLCGVGEHIVAVRSKKDFSIFVDCKSNASTLIPFHDPSITLLLTCLKTHKECNRAQLYSRMEECYAVARALGGKTLRCLALKELDALKCSKIPESYIRRARHVITENERVLKATEALKNNDYETLGELMVASHNSLRDNYEISNPELDFLVKTAMEVDGVLGSKMPSNSHSHSTLTLVKRWAVDDLIEYLQKNYSDSLLFFVISPHEHCGPLPVKEYVDAHNPARFAFEDIFPF